MDCDNETAVSARSWNCAVSPSCISSDCLYLPDRQSAMDAVIVRARTRRRDNADASETAIGGNNVCSKAMAENAMRNNEASRFGPKCDERALQRMKEQTDDLFQWRRWRSETGIRRGKGVSGTRRRRWTKELP